MMSKSRLRKWRTISRTTIVSDQPWLELSVERVCLPDGNEIERFYQVGLPEYAVIVALTEDGLVVMERQYKHAVGRVVCNLPAGYLDDGEGPLAGAKRELLEETGYAAKNWRRLGSFWVDGNRGCGRMHAFVAWNARRVCGDKNCDEVEEVEVMLVEPAEALRKLRNGQLVTMGSALAMSLAFLSLGSPVGEGGGCVKKRPHDKSATKTADKSAIRTADKSRG
jgi:ADP-ribose pyrophosphatase